ncbi:class I SAM-dependent methyltransferase [Streptomyces vinaceus]|uniref:class I SAM-dependent methyltransferase n=1 Tax=Streptomyces vinaceus TaxID=1960 RepID=UPI00368CB26C
MAESATRGLSFGEIVDRYDRFRPGVPAEALDWLVPDGCGTVIDLAAGTGALARSLTGRARQVIAVEPDPRMRERLARNCPEALPLHGTGEEMALPDGGADALLISMAWHWMDPQRAVPEIARVLRDGGTFGVLWNHRDLSVPWVAELDRFTRTLRAHESGQEVITDTPSRAVMDPPTGSLFNPLEERRLTWSMTMTAEDVVGHLGTDASSVALPAAAREAVDEQVARYLCDELGLAYDRTIELPMAGRCLRTTKVPGIAP